MIVKIPEIRQGGNNRFGALNRYITQPQEQQKEPLQQEEDVFNDLALGEDFTRVDSVFSALVNYVSAKTDAKDPSREKCTAIRTHGITDIANATKEMNAVAAKNSRVKDPTYHFILSWPEHERPANESIFDAAEHAIKALGLQEHQYIIAIHSNTDNIHCHISANRVHPVTFKSQNFEWSKNTLHLAARQSEIKHGWSHDNGNYIVQERGGKKVIEVNPDFAKTAGFERYIKYQKASNPREGGGVLNGRVGKTSKALQKDLPALTGWQELHAWLEKRDMALINTGGGGMRLQMKSADGEVVEVAASKGFRFLKRIELEERWGEFQKPIDLPPQITNTSHLTPIQIQKGVNHVITLANRIKYPGSPPDPYRPPDHILRAGERVARAVAQATHRLRELPSSGMDDAWEHAAMPLQNTVSDSVGDKRETAAGHQNVRWAGASEASGRGHLITRTQRDYATREERKQQRAAARADLQARYGIFVSNARSHDTDYVSLTKAIKATRSTTIKSIRQELNAAKRAIPKNASIEAKLSTLAEITRAAVLKKLAAEAKMQSDFQQLKATCTPIPGWQEWLHQQAQLGDQAAVSALRGIAYQANRDKFKNSIEEADTEDRVIAQLLEEEKRERAIRSVHIAQRPWEADALLRRYAETKWRVTGNGNVEYRQDNDTHLFTDRGNRVTFDKSLVTDTEIRLALTHAQAKFGNAVMLTGNDRIFSERMARIATEMNIGVLNPELKEVVAAHRGQIKHRTTGFSR